jgi:hypothetical protein
VSLECFFFSSLYLSISLGAVVEDFLAGCVLQCNILKERARTGANEGERDNQARERYVQGAAGKLTASLGSVETELLIPLLIGRAVF